MPHPITIDSLKEQLKKTFGFSQFRGEQEAIILNTVQGKNSFVLMPTGAGKSLCYQLPAIVMEGTAIVISPLIALMKNQVDQMVAFGITSWITLQALVNIAAIVNLLPLTGIPLPFFSYGSTALIANLAAVGILLNISRFGHKTKTA